MKNDNLQQWLAGLLGLLTDLSQGSLAPDAMLDALAQFCVDQLGAGFARIWLIDEMGATLVLRSSRGQYTNLHGTRARIAIGQGSKIDLMYTQGMPHITNDVLNDPGVKDKEWAQREGYISFAGYPLTWGRTKLGVMGMYSREPLSEDLLLVLGIFSSVTSGFIFQAQQTERNMNQFCQVTGFKRALLDRLVVLGRSAGEAKSTTMASADAIPSAAITAQIEERVSS